MTDAASMGVASLPQIALGVRAAMASPNQKPGGFEEAANGFLSLLESLKEPVQFKTKAMSPDGLVVSTTFIPMDYKAIFDQIGKSTQPRQRQPAASAM